MWSLEEESELEESELEFNTDIQEEKTIDTENVKDNTSNPVPYTQKCFVRQIPKEENYNFLLNEIKLIY